MLATRILSEFHFPSKNIRFENMKIQKSPLKTMNPYFSKTFQPKIFRLKMHPQKTGNL